MFHLRSSITHISQANCVSKFNFSLLNSGSKALSFFFLFFFFEVRGRYDQNNASKHRTLYGTWAFSLLLLFFSSLNYFWMFSSKTVMIRCTFTCTRRKLVWLKFVHIRHVGSNSTQSCYSFYIRFFFFFSNLVTSINN